ncbi:hypothetical protein N8911_00615 [bacterium]|nr:hypothetical protein [bacterium]
MSQNQINIDLKLVDTEFITEEAKEVVLSLFDYKIRFHQRKRFSNEERFEKNIHHSTVRIAELKKEKEKLLEYFTGLDKDARIRVSSKVEINQDPAQSSRKTA